MLQSTPTVRVYRHGHLFAGIGAGARGFNQAQPRVGNMVGRWECAGGIDVGGVEYLESERDGQIYLYDINALSNFVADAPAVVGFDPFARFVAYLARRAAVTHQPPAHAAA